MGGGDSKSAPAPSPTFDSAWRKVDWNGKQALLTGIKNHGIQRIRILLFGQVTAGKSSFVNSVDSILRGRMAHRASVGTGDRSHTIEYKTYKIQKEKKGEAQYYPFEFSDIMGLEAEHGIQEEDITLAMKGHVKDGYTFNPRAAISDKEKTYYNRDPAPEDQMHVVACFATADQVKVLSTTVIEKIRRIKVAARKWGIPLICIITKIDMLDPVMKKDVKNVYKLKIVKEKMEAFSTQVGVPMSNIFPVKNYHEETDLDDDIDVLILKALTHMINLGEDYINDM